MSPIKRGWVIAVFFILSQTLTACGGGSSDGNSNATPSTRPSTPTPVPAITIPTAPTGLSASPGDSRINLSWNASSGATSYNVKRASAAGGPYSTIRAGLTATSFSNTGLTNGSTYYYVVSAVNATGESANSAQVTATPAAATYLLNLTVTGTGTVTSTPTGINCGSDCSENYTGGTSVTLTAAAGSGSTFSGWGGHCAGSNMTCTVSMTAARTVTATFTQGTSSVWRPAPGTSWQWQITGVVDTSFNVTMYDIDLFDAVPSARFYDVPGFGRVNVPKGLNAGVIDTLHAQGRIVICYLDTGAYESYRPDATLFPHDVLGNKSYASTGDPWEGELWLDIRRVSWSKFLPLMAARMDLAKAIGCDGIEPDQNNPLGNNPGFPITAADQKAYYLEIARLAHERNLSVGQKNGIETTDAETIAAFDWNLNEECNQYDECDVLRAVVAAGKAVFQVEYVEGGMTAANFCANDNAANFDGLLKRLELGAWRVACR